VDSGGPVRSGGLPATGTVATTVKREIRRNGGGQTYRASWADRRAGPGVAPQPCPALMRRYDARAQKLTLQWSPAQMPAGKQRFPTDQTWQLSHENDLPSLSFRRVRAEKGADGGICVLPADAPIKAHRRADWGKFVDAVPPRATAEPRIARPWPLEGDLLSGRTHAHAPACRRHSRLRCCSRCQTRIRRPWWTRSPGTSASWPELRGS